MGHNVSMLGNHNLDITSIEALAKDLSKRFKAKVNYGYYSQYWFDIDGNELEPSYENVIFGYVKHFNSNKTLWLSDGFYQIRQVINKHGQNIYKLPCFAENSNLKLEIEAILNGVNYEIRDIENDKDYGILYNTTFQNFSNYFYGKWWNFCRAFMKTDDSLSSDIVNVDVVTEYRKDIKDFFTTIGSTEVVYLDDQGDTEYLTNDYHNWDKIMKELNSNFKETTLNISEFMKHKKLLPKDKYPLAFYDDFADL